MAKHIREKLQKEYNLIHGQSEIFVTTIGALSKYIINNGFDFVIFDECNPDKIVDRIDCLGITCAKIITISKECGIDWRGKNELGKYCATKLSDYCTVSWVEIDETISYPPSEKSNGKGEQKLTIENQKKEMFEMVWARMGISKQNRERILPIDILEIFLKQSVATYNGAKQEIYTVYDLDFLVKNTDIIIHGMVCQALAAQAIYENSIEGIFVKQEGTFCQMLPDVSVVFQTQYQFETNLYYQKLYCKF